MIIVGSGKSTTTYEEQVLLEQNNATVEFSLNGDYNYDFPLYQSYSFDISTGEFVAYSPISYVDEITVGSVFYRTNGMNGNYAGSQLYKYVIVTVPNQNTSYLETIVNLTTYYAKANTVYEGVELEGFNLGGVDLETIYARKGETGNLVLVWENTKSPDWFNYTGLDANGNLETSAEFDGTVVGYMLGDGSENACNGLDLNVFDLNASSIIVPSTHNGLPVTKVGQFALVPISAVDNAISIGGTHFAHSVIMPNLTEIKLGANLKEFDTNRSSIYVDYSLNCKVNIPSTVEIFQYPSYYTNAFAVKSSTIYDNRKFAEGSYYGADNKGNISCKKIIFSKNVETVGVFNDYKSTGSYFDSGFEEIEFETRTKPISLSETSFAYQTDLTLVNLPNTLDILPASCFNGCTALPSITIPASVTMIAANCFYNTTALTSMRFEHSSTDAITLETGMLSAKTAREMTIYTDNETIKNYDYATDNITATILHLDGSAWA